MFFSRSKNNFAVGGIRWKGPDQRAQGAGERHPGGLKQVLQETFEGTWLPHIQQGVGVQRYVETDIGGHYVEEYWPDFTVAEIASEDCPE